MKNNFINNIRHNYNNGLLIRDESWQKLSKTFSVLGKVQEQQDYLKMSATVDNFINCSVEDYDLLVRTNNIMFTTLLNLSDYLSYTTEGERDVIKNDKEAQKILVDCLENIILLREDLEEYYNEEM